ncbi:hypothetical protein PR048_024789 [Dryococelus australis]|uniref:Uncharacterized protein n=1 Tax=Dryococelus australis TaxID=614101 RepID=A0ABQ9GPJ2_9NEOP|nr:hypothetical protein PR048_024789 [Dryococelus australis]
MVIELTSSCEQVDSVNSINVQKFDPRETKWEIISFLRHCYYLFKNVPAIRADYILITESELFPKKFYAIRWLENVEVAERAMKILPHLKKFTKDVPVSSGSFNSLKSSLVDNLLEIKLTFFYSLASERELFLTIFQSESPMVPFLYDSLKDILLALVKKICEIRGTAEL